MDLGKTAQNIAHDLTPKSDLHFVRIVVGALLVGLGAVNFFVFTLTQRSWTTLDAIMTLSMVGLGMLVLFTKTTMDLIKTFPWPWVK